MKKFYWHNILIYGSEPSRREKFAGSIILIALYVLVWWCEA